MGEANASQSDAIYTRDEAVLIVEMFESVLDAYNIKVPSPEDDEREPDNEAKLYGSVYSDCWTMSRHLLLSYSKSTMKTQKS